MLDRWLIAIEQIVQLIAMKVSILLSRKATDLESFVISPPPESVYFAIQKSNRSRIFCHFTPPESVYFAVQKSNRSRIFSSFLWCIFLFGRDWWSLEGLGLLVWSCLPSFTALPAGSTAFLQLWLRHEVHAFIWESIPWKHQWCLLRYCQKSLTICPAVLTAFVAIKPCQNLNCFLSSGCHAFQLVGWWYLSIRLNCCKG